MVPWLLLLLLPLTTTKTITVTDLLSQMFHLSKACWEAVVVGNDNWRIQTLKIQHNYWITVKSKQNKIKYDPGFSENENIHETTLKKKRKAVVNSLDNLCSPDTMPMGKFLHVLKDSRNTKMLHIIDTNLRQPSTYRTKNATLLHTVQNVWELEFKRSYTLSYWFWNLGRSFINSFPKYCMIF